jgi:DNA-binding transcriptional MerR regulator
LASQYKVHEFARLAGVTVRALHHYDRLGLLSPKRTAAGYWLYGEPDLDRLQEIIALKSLGLRLNQIRLVLDRDASPLPDALRFHRGELEEKRRRLDCAIAAVEKAEKSIRPGKPADRGILKRIIAAIAMQEDADFQGHRSAWHGSSSIVMWRLASETTPPARRPKLWPHAGRRWWRFRLGATQVSNWVMQRHGLTGCNYHPRYNNKPAQCRADREIY